MVFKLRFSHQKLGLKLSKACAVGPAWPGFLGLARLGLDFEARASTPLHTGCNFDGKDGEEPWDVDNIEAEGYREF